MVIYTTDKIYLEKDELNYLKEINDKNEAFNKKNIKSVNVSINYIDYMYSTIPLVDIKGLDDYNFVEFKNLNTKKEFELYLQLKIIDNELQKEDISSKRVSYLKYMNNSIKKYLEKKKQYDEFMDIYFPKVLKLNIK